MDRKTYLSLQCDILRIYIEAQKMNAENLCDQLGMPPTYMGYHYDHLARELDNVQQKVNDHE